MSISLRQQLEPFASGTQKACVRKLQYRTREYAQRIADLRMSTVPERLYVYRCTHCDQWHITKMEPRS